MVLTHRLTSSRKGSLVLAGLAALIALILVLVYVSRYRHSVQSQSAPVTVLVARTTIPAGTPGTTVAAKSLYSSVTLRESQLRAGAFSDPSSLVGHAASQTIYAGQQLTSAEFAGNASSLASRLTDSQRVMAVPLDAAHGLVGQIHVGDHVDVYAGFNVVRVSSDKTPISGATPIAALRLIIQNVQVVAISSSSSSISGGSGTTDVSLKIDNVDAAKLAFASDNGKVWLSLRPSSGAKPTAPNLETAETILLGVPPVVEAQALGGR